MSRFTILILLVCLCSCSGRRTDEERSLGILPGTEAPGWPVHDNRLDVLPGFRNPPPGYGEVPFWWWSGDTLNPERLTEQLRQLHSKGISGVQVNYSHLDTPGWMTDQDKPGIFSNEWWKIWSRVARESARLKMGIGMSTYTIDWQRGAPNLFHKLFYSKPHLNAFEIEPGEKLMLRTGEIAEIAVSGDTFTARAYRSEEGSPLKGGIDLTPLIRNGRLTWEAPEGTWEIWTYRTVRKEGSLNPLMPGAGDTVLNGFFRPFEKMSSGKASKGLNYFFNDELQLAVGKYAWNPDFPEEFRKRKGYDLFEVLPAMWVDIGNISPKVKMDYADVRMSLIEERYFRPIYLWHAERGMIFGCDSWGRGLDPSEFGDYFRATRWYTAPGHDTPGGKADLIKGRVSSSIANLYRRPRVWLEGYHSLGWGASPEQLMYATRENFLYGCTLLNLHGLYYSTYGSFWEWAPPCYHFRMPYWDHMDSFLSYFDRLSWLMSQGHTVCDVAIVYPVAPYEAEMDGETARNTSFELGEKLMAAGISFEFIDNESLARAVVENACLNVKHAGASYKALVFADMNAVRWQSIEKAAAFAGNGGNVFSVGALPSASDRTGRSDGELIRINDLTFKDNCRFNTVDEAVEAIRNSFKQDVTGIGQTVRYLHRKAGFRDVYMVMDAKPGSTVEFRCKGRAELWDPWTGETKALRVKGETPEGTLVELPLEEYEAQIVVFTPGKKHVNPPETPESGVSGEIYFPLDWNVSFIPTMDNKWGDFRLPVTGRRMIGPEARRFRWARETKDMAETAMLPETDDSTWEEKLHGFGSQLYVLGPVSKNLGIYYFERKLAEMKHLDPSVPEYVYGRKFEWEAYDFSWRQGKEGDPGHQGYHGLKRTVSNDFLCLGKPEQALNEIRYVDEIPEGRYYIWTTVTVDNDLTADILFSDQPPQDKSHTAPVLTPSVIYVNGTQVSFAGKGVNLKAGVNTILARYDHAGRGHFVLRLHGAPEAPARRPLSMKWADDDAVIPFDIYAGKSGAEWFRFLSAPGTSAVSFETPGEAGAWIDGMPMKKQAEGRFVAEKVPEKAAVVAIRIIPPRPGITGGALIPEPIEVETDGSGLMRTGDWSECGILKNYSGGIRYRNKVSITSAQAKSGIIADLGKVAGTAAVYVNGKKAGVRVAPPWKTDISAFMKKGENTIEVIVYNTLANHYQTIPSLYRGDPASGLLGPVRLLVEDRKK